MRNPTECLAYIRLQNWYPAAKLNESFWRRTHWGHFDRYLLECYGIGEGVVRPALAAGLATYRVVQCDRAYSDFLNRSEQ